MSAYGYCDIYCSLELTLKSGDALEYAALYHTTYIRVAMIHSLGILIYHIYGTFCGNFNLVDLT